MEPNELVCVCTLKDAAVAELIKNDLQRNGIDCRIGDQRQAGLTGVLDVEVNVRREDVAAARKLLEAHGVI